MSANQPLEAVQSQLQSIPFKEGVGPGQMPFRRSQILVLNELLVIRLGSRSFQFIEIASFIVIVIREARVPARQAFWIPHCS